MKTNAYERAVENSRMRGHFLYSLCICLSAISNSFSQESKKDPGPLSPREELATFRTLQGVKVELVASEPDVVDPVAMCFDERGRLFVCEMIGYPNGGIAKGAEKRGRIRLLIDEKNDGVYSKSMIYADGLRFPTGVMAWNGGIIVTVAPDIIFLKDTKGDGKANEKRILYTGFGLDNIQQIINSPQWALDNWVYAMNGSSGGTITSPEKPDMKPVVLHGPRGVRFKPDVPGSLEPTSGGGQYGICTDDFQHWFANTNSQHLRQIVLPDHYLRRNPYMTVPAVSLDIPDHGAACKLNRISPFEGWRVERTTRRKGGPDAKRFPETELVPGGYVTSSCSPIVYTASLFPATFRNNTFICEPANNLIHRDILEVKGSVFSARRADVNCEFLASTDNWFRPVFLTVGPEGAIYVCDFYREVIETPLSLPDDIKKRLNLESRGRGRIWRIVSEGFKSKPFAKLDKAKPKELVNELNSPNSWRRNTAQRMIVELGKKSTFDVLDFAMLHFSDVGYCHFLWTKHGLDDQHFFEVQTALSNANSGVRESGLRFAEEFAEHNEEMRAKIIELATDPDPHVRLQAAFSLGALPADEAAPALVKLLSRPDADSWLQTAVFSSAKDAAPAMLETLVLLQAPANTSHITRLAAMVGAKGDDAGIARTLILLGKAKADSPEPMALLGGLGQGMQNSTRPLSKLLGSPPDTLKEAVTRALPIFHKTSAIVRDEKQPLSARLTALRLLTYAPSKIAIDSLVEMLSSQQPLEVQSAAVRALASRSEPQIASALLAAWNRAGPSLRRELLEALFARPDRIAALLDAIEAKKLNASQLEATRVQLLLKHPDVTLRARASKLLAGLGDSDRRKIVDDYKDSLGLKPDVAKGKMLFAKNCAACHRLEDVGNEVGANLQAALRTKSKEALLIDILDPSREVDPRYVNYRVTTLNGQSYTGILAVETPSSITLRRAEKAEDTILRNQIEEITATAKSLMPDEFEKQLSKQDVADLIAYLLHVVDVK